MKKKMLAVLLPVAAGVALAGTGFGAWVFSQSANTYTGASVTVTEAVADESLTVLSNNVNLLLDQAQSATPKTNRSGDTEDAVAITDENDYFILQTDYDYDAGGSLNLSSTVNYSTSAEVTETWSSNSSNPAIKVKTSYKIKCTFSSVATTGDNLSTYISLTGMGVDNGGTTGAVTNSLANGSGTEEYTFDNTVSINSAAAFSSIKVLPTFTWISGKVPTNMTTYRAMEAAAANTKIVFEISVTGSVRMA